MKDRKLDDPSAWLISEALSQLGVTANPADLVRKVERLQDGLPLEDEFSVLITWLGRCKLVHKLDQLQSPKDSKKAFRVPDLLAVFQKDKKQIPVLIEVKSTVEDKLSWRPDYYEALKNYGHLLGLPVLLAWKHKPMGMWTLVDINEFHRPQQNFQLSLNWAFKQNLLSELAGDFSYDFQKGVGLHFRMKKLAELTGKEPNVRTFKTTITEAYFTNSTGKHFSKLGPGMFWLFLGTESEDHVDETTDELFSHFEVDPEAAQVAHRILPIVVSGLEGNSPVPWRQVLENRKFTTLGTDVLREATASIAEGIVGHILLQAPQREPPFLEQ